MWSLQEFLGYSRGKESGVRQKCGTEEFQRFLNAAADTDHSLSNELQAGGKAKKESNSKFCGRNGALEKQE